MFSIKLSDSSPVSWPSLDCSVWGLREVGTERFSTVRTVLVGAGLGRTSAIWGVQEGGPVLQPTQLQETESQELQRKQ